MYVSISNHLTKDHHQPKGSVPGPSGSESLERAISEVVLKILGLGLKIVFWIKETYALFNCLDITCY